MVNLTTKLYKINIIFVIHQTNKIKIKIIMTQCKNYFSQSKCNNINRTNSFHNNIIINNNIIHSNSLNNNNSKIYKNLQNIKIYYNSIFQNKDKKWNEMKKKLKN